MATFVKKMISNVDKQIICIHVGTTYSDEYVEKLYRSCDRNINSDYIFTVITDRESYDINADNFRTIPIVQKDYIKPGKYWWYKMQAFNPNIAIEGQNLLIDIDTVIVNELDKFFTYYPNRFVIIQDFNRQWYPSYRKSNSSVVKFNKELAEEIYIKWSIEPETYIKKYRGDQDWFDGELNDKIKWPTEWIQSWKWEVYKGGMITPQNKKYYSEETKLNSLCSILAFHGKPNPEDVTKEEIIKENWR